MEYDLREKDRLIDEREEEIENAKTRAKQDSEHLEGELDEARRRVEELEDQEENATRSAAETEQITKALQEAREARDRAESDLDELREEMANKSINTKGLNRQIEEKAQRAQVEMAELRDKHLMQQTSLEDQARLTHQLREELQDRELDTDVQIQKLKNQNELLQNDNDSLKRKVEFADQQMQRAVDDLNTKSEEKDLLHARHDALTTESHQLQKDLTRMRSLVDAFEKDLENEKQRALDNDFQLRSQSATEIDHLQKDIEKLHKQLRDQEDHAAAEKELWNSQRRGLELQKEKAEEKSSGLQRTVGELQKMEGTLSTKESQLQRALESERDRHGNEEQIFERQIQNSNSDLEKKRQMIEELQHRLAETEEEIVKGSEERSTIEEKVQSLEDEVEVLQVSLDEEIEKAQIETSDLRDEVHALQSELAAAKERTYKSNTETNLDAIEKKSEEMQADIQSWSDRLATKNVECHRLQSSIAKIEAERDNLRDQVTTLQGHLDEAVTTGMVQKELSAARDKETESLHREAAQKDIVKGLKLKVDQLERQAHEAEIARLLAKSPASNNGSAQKDEINELRRQLLDARRHLKDARVEIKAGLRASQKTLEESTEQVRKLEELHEQLEADLFSAQQDRESLQSQAATSSTTITRLRSRISTLEQDAQSNRRRTLADDTIAEERKDLHELLKDAKLEAEDLRLKMNSTENKLAVATSREKDLKTNLKRLREERSFREQKVVAFASELDVVQRRHDRAVERFSRQQKAWNEERQEMMSRVRFPNNSVSEMQRDPTPTGREMMKTEKQHACELQGLAKQIQWLKAKVHREGAFRAGLVYEKNFLLMRIGMFEAWYVFQISSTRAHSTIYFLPYHPGVSMFQTIMLIIQSA